MFRSESYTDTESFKKAYILAGYENFSVSLTVSDTAVKFADYAKSHKCFAVINDCFVFSDDNASPDDIVKFVTGKTIQELNDSDKQWKDEYDKKEAEFKNKIPALEKEYIRRGKEILKPEYIDLWIKVVPARLNDLYHGYELECTLQLIDLINHGESFEKVNACLEDQGHSGMSYGLEKAMLKAFGGSEFVDWLDEHYPMV